MADEFFTLELTGNRKLLQAFGDLPEAVRIILREKIRVWTERTRDMVADLIQQRLQQKTGELLRNLDVEIVEEGLKINGRVYISGVPYAKAQEQGATTQPHIITPKESKVLVFMAATGDKVFATRVFHPGGTIPAHWFMRDAYRIMSPKITDGLYYELIRKLQSQMGMTNG